MAIENSKPPKRRLGGKAGDAVVMTAMALVTLALCAGLVVQAGLGFWLAGTVSLSFYMGLLTLHAIARRSGQIDDLQREVDRLKAALGQGDETRAPMPQQQTAATGVAAPKPNLEHVVQAPSAVAKERGKERGLSGTMPPPPYVPAAAGQAMAPPPRPEIASSAPAPSLSPAAGSGKAPSQSARPDGPPAPVASAPPLPNSPQKSTASEAPAAPGLSSELMSRMQRVVRGSQSAPPPPPSNAGHPAGRQPVVPSSPPLRQPHDPRIATPPAPPRAPDHAQATSQPPPAAFAPAMPHAATPPPPPATSIDAPAIDDVPTDVRMPADALGHRSPSPFDPSPREADVEMIQGLIKKLAAEVNAVEADKLTSPPPPPPPQQHVEQAVITQSVDALKRTAQTMREPARSELLEGELEDAVRKQRAAKAVAAEIVAKSPPPPPPVTGVPDPEFDVETLMRRAQSIAAMDSPPAPLPEAPNPAAAESEPPSLAGSQAGASRQPALEAPAAAASLPPAGEDQLDRIAAALDAGRVEVFLEPILDLVRAQPSHYEVTVRLRDETGAEIDGGPIGEDGEASVELPLLDSIRLSRTAQVAQLLEDRRKPGSVFSTFHGPSLASDDFLSTFAETLDAQQGLPSKLVLTFAQADVRRFRPTHWNMIEEMRDLGFRFAMRAVTDLDMDFEALNGVGFQFVKLDADVFLDGLPTPGDVIPAEDLCKHLADLGFSVVVEHLDDEAKRARVFGFGVLLGQGQLFGGPRLMKASALAATTSRAA